MDNYLIIKELQNKFLQKSKENYENDYNNLLLKYAENTKKIKN